MKLKLSLFRDHHICTIDREYDRNKTFITLLKSTCLPWAGNHSTRTHFLSPRSLQLETDRNSFSHPHSIHPFSKFNLFREGVMFLLTFARLSSNEFSFFYLDRPFCYKSLECKYVLIFLTYFVFFLNIVLHFFTGYVEKNTKLVQLGQKQIAMKYFSTFFFLDVIICIPYLLVWKFLMYKIDPMTYLWLNLISRFILGLSIIRIFIYFHTLGQAIGISRVTRNVMWSLLFLVLLAFFVSPFIYLVLSQILVGQINNPDEYYNILPDRILDYSLYANYGCYLSLISLGQRGERLITEFSFSMFIKCFLIVINLYGYLNLMASLVILYQNTYTKILNYFEWYHKVKAVLRKHKVKKKQRKQLSKAFESRYFTGLHWDRRLLEMLGDSIVKTVALERCKRFFGKQPILHLMSEDEMVLAGSLLEEEVYLSKKVVFQIGSLADSMYYINNGRASGIQQDGKVVVEFGSGDFFGEVSLIEEHAERILKVVTTDTCYFLILTKYNFDYILSILQNTYEPRDAYFISRRDLTTAPN